MKILLVEDEEHVLRLERTVLMADGFDVETAAGGQEALQKLKNVPYDGIVLDMRMPDIDGCEVARQLRSIQPNSRTPVIMVTAGLDRTDRQRAFDAGAVAFINKPFTAEAFRSAIHAAISEPQRFGGPTRPSGSAEPSAGRSTPTPDWRRPRPAVGKVVVRSETGATYDCPPHAEGGWRCGRCELGLITAEHDLPSIGSRCTVCQAEVVGTDRKRWWPFS